MSRQPIRGAFLFADEWQAWTTDAAREHLEALAARGVTHIFTESDTYRDDVIDAAHLTGLRWIGGIACFSDHAHQHWLLEERPELWPIDAHGAHRPLMEWYIGVTPTFEDYNATRLALAERLVREHALDGFMLDFIRWPIHWELELRSGAQRAPESSFDAHTLARFQAESGVKLPIHLYDSAAHARWIHTHAAAEWVEFKCRVITRFVREYSHRIRNAAPAGFEFGLYTLPLPPGELASIAGQRLEELAPLVDWIAPMAYHAILDRLPAWVAEVIDYTRRAAPGQVLPVVQISSSDGTATGADWGPPISSSEAAEVLSSAMSADTLGAIAFPGLALLSGGS